MTSASKARDRAAEAGATRPPRVALVTNVLSHYRVPCFRALAQHLERRLTIFLLSQGMDHRAYVQAGEGEDLPLVMLPGRHFHRPPHDDRHLNDLRPIMRGDFDIVIISGWDEPTYLLLWGWSLLRRKRILFWIESTPVESSISGIKGFYKRSLLKRASGCIVPGQRSATLCQQLGVAEERIFLAPNAADREYFSSQADLLLRRRADLRLQLDLEDFTILLVGRLVEQFKGVSTLIEACAALEGRGIRLSLLIAGDGPDRPDYVALADRAKLRDVRFLGTLDHDSLCGLYAAADLLAVPSRSEPWGFVLNEGMEFGLPLVVSDAVGAGPDLVRPGENGLVVPTGDAEALSLALLELASDPDRCSRFGEVSRRLVREFNPQRWAEGVMRSVSERS